MQSGDLSQGRALEDMEVMNDGAAPEVEEVLAHAAVAGTGSLPSRDVG
jgi:hypothetical protein